jgi:tripartite ATP-independent transporter DctM subunit
VEGTAAVLFGVNLVVVCYSVLCRYVLNRPVEWADDVARGLLVGLSFFGAASALARGENVGIEFFVNRLPDAWRRRLETAASLLVALVTTVTTVYALELAHGTSGQTSGSGLPLNPPFYAMGIASLCMTLFAVERLLRHRLADIATACAVLATASLVWTVWDGLSPGSMPSPIALMLACLVVCLVGGLPIAFVLALSTLLFVWRHDSLPGVIFAQQLARGIDNFVLLAIPFFILVGAIMEVNGMSVRLIELIRRLLGRRRGGLDTVMVLSMLVFSGVSGSKMADIAAVGSVLVPAARRSGQDPGKAVALLAASAVMGETVPPCINLIILGFVANISIGGLFIAGVLPAILMAGGLIAVSVIRGAPPAEESVDPRGRTPLLKLLASAAISLGLVGVIVAGFTTGFATVTEICSFAVVYSIVVGGLVFRELTLRAVVKAFVDSARRAGLVLFIVAAAQTFAFALTIEQIPHALATLMVDLSSRGGSWLFMGLTIVILIVMGSVLEGAAALIIFGPLLVPVAEQLGFHPLHYGVVLVVSMGIGLFAPPLGLGLYGSCLIGGVPIEATVKPMVRYLGLLFLCLLIIAFVPRLTLLLPHAFHY